MQSILLRILALSLLVSCAAPPKNFCDPKKRENVCLVPASFIVGNSLSNKEQFVEFDSAKDTLDTDCSMMFLIKNMNSKQWLLQFHTSIIQASYYVVIGGLRLEFNDRKVIAYNETETPLHQYGSAVFVSRVDSREYFKYLSIIEGRDIENLRSFLMNTNLKLRVATDEVKFALTDEFLLRVENTKSCDPHLIDVKIGPSREGELIDVLTTMFGAGASIDCKHKSSDRLYIKRASDPEFIEVNEVSCPDEVWAVKYMNKTVQNLGTERFELKCVRNHCKFCGKISEQTCDKCTPIEYDDCQPQCKSQLWVRKNHIIKSNITCKPLDGDKNADSGLWYLVSNGVDLPFEEGSCYNGPFPLPDEVKAISDSSPSFSQRAILLVLLIAFI